MAVGSPTFSKPALGSMQHRIGVGAEWVDHKIELVSRLLRAAMAGAMGYGTILHLQGKERPAELSTAVAKIDMVQSGLGAVRAVVSLAKLATGKVFWTVKEGKIERRGWISAALDTQLCIARILSPLTWLHRLGTIDLGAHAARIGTTIGTLYTIVTGICLSSAIHQYVTAKKGEVEAALVTLIAEIGDAWALLWDLGYCFNTPELSIVGEIGQAFSSFAWIAREAYQGWS